MADLLSPSLGLDSDPIMSRESNLDLEAAFPSHPTIASQIVLKLESVQHATPPEVDIAPAVLNAFQTLVNLITHLRSPAGGWLEEQPPTPETLAPYVQDEVQDLLDALNANDTSASQPYSSPSQFAKLEAGFSQHGFLWLKSITDWLLWGIARSSDQLMRLMEGCSATCALPDQEAQTGILRLVPLLELQTPTISYRLDLTTDQLDVLLLPDEAIVQLDTKLCPEPTSVASLVGQLSEQSRLATPAIAAFFQGVWVETLIPHYTWQSGTLQLYFGLEFTPAMGLMEVDRQHVTDLTPTIQFTDTAWVEQYTETIVQQRLADILAAGVNWQTLIEEPADATLPSSLIALAHHASQDLQTSLTIASRHLLNPPLCLDELTSRLHWCLLHSAYEIMQLMSGISVQWLQPRSQPQSGTLRLAFLLQIQTSDQTWAIDLITGRSLDSSSFLTESTAVVQSQECSWCESLSLLEQLEKQVWQQINQRMPEIWYLLQGADIDAQVNGQDRQPGTLQLHGGFQFAPFYSATRIG